MAVRKTSLSRKDAPSLFSRPWVASSLVFVICRCACFLLVFAGVALLTSSRCPCKGVGRCPGLLAYSQVSDPLTRSLSLTRVTCHVKMLSRCFMRSYMEWQELVQRFYSFPIIRQHIMSLFVTKE